MSQSFVRCNQCGAAHDVTVRLCPATGRPVERRGAESAPPAPPLASPLAPPPPPTEQEIRIPPPERASIPSLGSAPSTREELIGQTIEGKYQVQGILGMGGMGTVLAAEHVAIGRPVAIKVLHKNQLHKGRAVRRFEREARAAGGIGHPNICEVYDVGTLEDGSPFLVMERLVGETFAALLRTKGPLAIDDIVELFGQILSGLLAAHEKGIVHRDVKPANVFVTRPIGYPSVVKILDFGISMLPFASSEDSGAGLVMGTPHYMAPEQAGGEPDLDGRVDVYSCGVMLYEAVTGSRPYTGRNFEALLAQVLTTEPRPARELRPDMPAGLEPIIARALAKPRQARYPSVAAFLADLQSLRSRLAASPRVPEPLPTERDLGAWALPGDDDDVEELSDDDLVADGDPAPGGSGLKH
jgi:eukaryotic-like serine/threonine-protein kinase